MTLPSTPEAGRQDDVEHLALARIFRAVEVARAKLDADHRLRGMRASNVSSDSDLELGRAPLNTTLPAAPGKPADVAIALLEREPGTRRAMSSAVRGREGGEESGVVARRARRLGGGRRSGDFGPALRRRAAAPAASDAAATLIATTETICAAPRVSPCAKTASYGSSTRKARIDQSTVGFELGLGLGPQPWVRRDERDDSNGGLERCHSQSIPFAGTGYDWTRIVTSAVGPTDKPLRPTRPSSGRSCRHGRRLPSARGRRRPRRAGRPGPSPA